jgi:hypothetical protein
LSLLSAQGTWVRLPARPADGACPIAAAAGHRQEAARILRDEVFSRSDDGNPPLELSERTEQILASRDSLPPMKSGPELAFSLR